nr:putative nucleotidyltransferase, ribonuclease H [Tanacetum cinerariifolium]
MESLKKIKINQPLLKEIKQANNYPRHMKDQVVNKQLTKEVDEVSMNPRCSARLQNQLPPKENDPGSFILPCTIGRFREVSETARNKILRDYWRKTFGNEYNDRKDFEDPDGCGESKENKILITIINKLHDEWFKGTDDDDNDLEGIIDYLEPTLYDKFIDSDDKEYKENKCRLLGMPYIKPPPILIEK